MDKPHTLLNALLQLSSLIQSGNPPMDCYGICTWLNIYAYIDSTKPDENFIDLCHKWPKCLYDTDDGTNYWKSYCYPIVDYRTYKIDKHAGTTWSNPTRLEFIDWAIDYLTQEQFK